MTRFLVCLLALAGCTADTANLDPEPVSDLGGGKADDFDSRDLTQYGPAPFDIEVVGTRKSYASPTWTVTLDAPASLTITFKDGGASSALRVVGADGSVAAMSAVERYDSSTRTLDVALEAGTYRIVLSAIQSSGEVRVKVACSGDGCAAQPATPCAGEARAVADAVASVVGAGAVLRVDPSSYEAYLDDTQTVYYRFESEVASSFSRFSEWRYGPSGCDLVRVQMNH